MGVPTNAYQTYQSATAGNIREDLSGMITNIAPADTLFYSAIGSEPCKNTKHEWLTDTLPAAGSNKLVEGDAAGDATAVVPRVRLYNYTQIQGKVVEMSNTQQAVDTAGVANDLDYQIANIYMPALAKDTEYAFLNGVRAVGSASVAREMGGLLNSITTNLDKASDATLNADGTVTGGTARPLSSAMVRGMMQAAYNAGGSADTIYCTAFQAGQFSQFQQTNNFRSEVVDGKLSDLVDVYKTEAGLVKVKIHRGMTSGVIVGVDHKYWKKATLRPEGKTKLAKTGDSDKYQILVEHTLAGKAEASSWRITDLTTSITQG